MKEVKFPPLSIDQIEEFYFCAKCNHKAIPNAKLLNCINCGAKSLKNDANKRYQTKLSFKVNEFCISINVPHKVMMQLLSLINMTVSDDVSDIELKLLETRCAIAHYQQNTILKFTKIE